MGYKFTTARLDILWLNYTVLGYISYIMAHTSLNKKKLQARIKRLQGQLTAVAQALTDDKDCNLILQTLAACRGAFTGLTADILEDHIRAHIIPEKGKWNKKNETAVQETIDVIRSYLK
jgi:DNA-binding FrmR family transcriptional regulator